VPEDNLTRFLHHLEALPAGFTRGTYKGAMYGVSIDKSMAGLTKLFARELGGADIVSFNLYSTPSRRLHLRPCEMSSATVMDFVEGFRPSAPGGCQSTEESERGRA